jgi:hypothetical protein
VGSVFEPRNGSSPDWDLLRLDSVLPKFNFSLMVPRRPIIALNRHLQHP